MVELILGTLLTCPTHVNPIWKVQREARLVSLCAGCAELLQDRATQVLVGLSLIEITHLFHDGDLPKFTKIYRLNASVWPKAHEDAKYDARMTQSHCTTNN